MPNENPEKKAPRNKYTAAAYHATVAISSFEKATHHLSSAIIGLPKKAVAARENLAEARKMFYDLETNIKNLVKWLEVQATIPTDQEKTDAEEHPADSQA